jgi:GTPase SAR1 family protein
MMTAPFEFLRAQVLELCDELGQGTATESMELLRKCEADLNQNFVVVVCGEFSRGKSSLLNALIERRSLFPVGTDVTTSVVTELRWGPLETAEIILDDSAATVGFEEAADYLTEQGNPFNVRGVRLVRMTAPVELLRPGLVLIDTPGIGSLNFEHATATYAYLGSADAVIFVGAADERMSASELDYLAKAMDKCPAVITVLGKIDNLHDLSLVTEVKVARQRISDRTGREESDITVVGVSARRKRAALAAGDDDKLAESGYPELEQALWAQLVETQGKPRLYRAVSNLDRIITDRMAPLAQELSVLSGKETIAKVRADLEENRRRAAELEAQSADWRKHMASSFETKTAPIRQRLAQDIAAVRESFVATTMSSRALGNPAEAVQETGAALVDAAQSAGQALRAAAQEVAESAAAETRLPVTPALDEIAEPDVRLDVPAALLERSRSAGLVQSVFKAAAAGGGVGMAIGAAIGTLIFPGLGPAVGVAGGLVGQVVGLFAGFRDHAATKRETLYSKRTGLLTDVTLPKVDDLSERVRHEIGLTITTVGRGLEAELARRIRMARQYVAESLEALELLSTEEEAAWTREYEQVSAKLAALQSLRTRLGDLLIKVDDLGKES